MLKVLTIGMVSFLYPTIIGNVLADAILSIQLHVDLKVGQENICCKHLGGNCYLSAFL